MPAGEFLTESAGDMDEAPALFPAAPSLFKLTGFGVLEVAAFPFFAVPAIELQSHYRLHSKESLACFMVGRKLLKRFWR